MKKQRLLLILLTVVIGIALLVACQAGSSDTDDRLPEDEIITSVDDAENDDTQSESDWSLWAPKGSPFDRYGKLQVNGTQLCDQDGKPVQLKGMSSFGLQWGDGFWVLTEEAFDVLADDWECDIIRLAMYIAESGYRVNPDVVLERLEKGIELASQRGMYVMIDWHVLNPGDPTSPTYLEAGLGAQNMPPEFRAIEALNPDWTGPQVFFAYIAEKYGHQGNLIYEPANEPNGVGSWGERFNVWSDTLKPYFESVIEVIRMYDETSIIICGTDNWSQFVDAPSENPIDDPQVMYAMHFYSGTHDAGPGNGDYWLRGIVDNALENGLPVFCSEWGTSEATGDGGPYIDYAYRWVQYMEDKGISWCAWSMAQKNEISAAFNKTTSPTPVGAWPDSEVSIAGRFYRAMIKGDPVPMYTKDGQVATDPSEGVHNGDIAYTDDPGEFVKIPFDFESGTREGWSQDGDSMITSSDLSVATAETQALMFPFTFDPDKGAWEDGARLGSPMWRSSALPMDVCLTINGFVMEVFLEDNKATTGSIKLSVALIPDGDPYWHIAGTETFDAVSGGTVITNDDGAQLRKYTVAIPFSVADYGDMMRVRNIILALHNDGSDYSGNIYYDNIGFILY